MKGKLMVAAAFAAVGIAGMSGTPASNQLRAEAPSASSQHGQQNPATPTDTKTSRLDYRAWRKIRRSQVGKRVSRTVAQDRRHAKKVRNRRRSK